MEIGRLINEFGGIARTAELLQRGATRAGIERATSQGEVRRIQRGWYATTRVPRAVVTAVLSGGRVGCVTALTLQGVWMVTDSRVHVCIDQHGRARPRPGTVMHWREPVEKLRYPMDNVSSSLEQLARCRPLLEVVVAGDSILNRELASESEVVAALSMSANGRRALSLLDGSAESGIETLARVPLVRRGIRLRTQVLIEGVGHVDIVVGDRLVLEVDGEEWHGGDAFETDRKRDAALIALGYLVLRCSYRQVMDGWGDIEMLILELVRRREHLWRAGDEPRGHLPRNYRRSRRPIG